MLKEYLANDIVLHPNTWLLGDGGSAVVILAFLKELGKKVAIKCFSVSGNRADAFLRKIKEELEMLQHAEHVHIARVYGWVKWQQRFIGIIMEYYPQGDLLSVLQSGLTLPPVVRLRIAFEVAASLSSVHEGKLDKRLIHGDLKPENVLLDEKLHCKLADFGSAKLVPLTKAITTMRISQQEASDPKQLTPMYAAPELLTNITMDPKKEQDTYSYGIVVYTILALRLPYNTNQLHDVTAAVTAGQRPDCEEIQHDKETLAPTDQRIIESLVEVMEACWQPDKEMRPKMSKVRQKLGDLLFSQNQDYISQCFQTLSAQLQPCSLSTETWKVCLDGFNPLNPPAPVPEQRSGTVAQLQKVPTDLSTKRFSLYANHVAEFIQQLGKACMTPQDLGKHALLLREHKQHPSAVFYLHTAAACFTQDPDPAKVMEGVLLCINEMKLTVDEMLDEKEINYLPYVHDHILPLMHKVELFISINDNLSNDAVNFHLACVESIWSCEAAIGDLSSSEQTLKMALSLLERAYRDQAQKFACYASCLYNLGEVCWKSGKIEEAVEYFSRALVTYRNATDMKDDDRQRVITSTRNNLISISSP